MKAKYIPALTRQVSAPKRPLAVAYARVASVGSRRYPIEVTHLADALELASATGRDVTFNLQGHVNRANPKGQVFFLYNAKP